MLASASESTTATAGAVAATGVWTKASVRTWLREQLRSAQHIRAQSALVRQQLLPQGTADSDPDPDSDASVAHATHDAPTSTPSLALRDAVASSAAIGVYLSMPTGEIDTLPIVRSLLACGKRVFVPRVLDRTRMALLEVHSWHDVQSLPVNSWGIAEPDLLVAAPHDPSAASASAPSAASAAHTTTLRAEAADSDDLRVILVPGLAFDARCRRLGHGRGYYDRYLHALNEKRAARGLPHVVTIGLALREQILSTEGAASPASASRPTLVPTAEHDVVLDHVVTADHVFSSEPSPQTSGGN